ncbi:ABC transporter permease [Microbacterium sp. NPDC019599]|uniref:ABC transporter permease n=1 Tax=Microbacterium sp. NPDC019599 TaxID=3154690 RepID=UPI0034091695
MRNLGTAIETEARKASASRVVPWTTGILIGGLAALTLGLLAAAAAGDERVIARLGPLAELDGWPLLVGTAAQILAAGGLGACGVLVSWLFGREFTEGTVSGLYALPVRRSTIAIGKLIVYLTWAMIVALTVTLVLGILGAAAGMLSTDADRIGELARIPLLMALTALIAVPAAWVASLARSILAGIAATIVLMIVAQVSAILGVGAWVPLVAPALWAIAPSSVPAGALIGVLSIPAVFCAATAYVWARLQLDR